VVTTFVYSADRGDNDVEQQTVSPAVNGHAATNGSDSNSQNDDSDSSVTERIGDGDVTPNENSKTASVTQRASRRDSVLITGRKENCEAAKAAILVNYLQTFIYLRISAY
jgi:hypothetical protein